MNNLLDIKSVTVIDQDGNDVTNLGTLSIENNRVVFSINKQEGSYAFLAGKTFVMTISTQLRSDLTEEELAPYVIPGIPNQASLAFGNKGETVKSQVPRVMPNRNTPQPEGTLPFTGEATGVIFSVVGLLLIISAVLMLIRMRRTKLE